MPALQNLRVLWGLRNGLARIAHVAPYWPKGLKVFSFHTRLEAKCYVHASLEMVKDAAVAQGYKAFFQDEHHLIVTSHPLPAHSGRPDGPSGLRGHFKCEEFWRSH